ncbi:cilia- and flagella-associated protein 99 [Menidia menidia]
MASSYVSLVKESIVLLDKFRADRRCLDDFIEDALKDLETTDTLQRTFILDVVSGCTEYKKLVDVVVNAFYGQKGKQLSRGDHSQYVVICYLTMFALDELGLQHFCNIVKSLGIKKMHTFLSFFFSNLTSWIQEEWNGIYDAAFVEKHWMGPLLRWRPEINTLMDQLAAKISQGSQIKKAPVKTTKPLEFSLTKPKPRPLLMPELIPQQEKCKPVPDSTYRAPKETQIIGEIKEKNHQKAEELLYEANMTQFRCVNPQKSEHTQRSVAQIMEEQDSKLQFNSFQASGLPPTIKRANSRSVKLNNAAILRREALCDREVEKELQRIQQLLQGGREPSSFLQWQREMLQRDLQERLPMIERKRLETRITDEEVALARKQVVERNQRAAQLKKEETAQLMQRYAEKRLQEEKELRDLVQQVAEGHKNSKAAQEKLQKWKQSIVKEVSQQSQELLRQALEEEQAKLHRRFEIIHEIHSIESLPHIRVNKFDETQTAGHELRAEMSLAELKERLALLRAARQSEEEERRSHILEEKQLQKKLLLERLDAIETHRRELVKASDTRKEEKKAKQDFFQQVVAQDETVLALRRKLEEKKQERQRWKHTESSDTKPSRRTTAPTVGHAGNHRQSLNEKSWEELEQNLMRCIQDTPDDMSWRDTPKTQY